MINKHIRKVQHVLGALLATLAVTANAADGKWTEGFGQGNYEYFIDAGGMRLYIGCPTDEGATSSVSLMSVASSQEVKKFSVQVGGHSFDGPFAADSRAGDDNFTAFLNNLRKSDAVVSYGGKTIKFPKSNAAQVLPVPGKKGFACTLSF